MCTRVPFKFGPDQLNTQKDLIKTLHNAKPLIPISYNSNNPVIHCTHHLTKLMYTGVPFKFGPNQFNADALLYCLAAVQETTNKAS